MALELNGTTGVSLVQDGTITSAKLQDGIVTPAKLSGVTQGITMADQWRINNAIQQGSAHTETVINTNLERCDEVNFGGVGSPMTQSSGVFTFPETGIYLVTFTATYYVPDDSSARYVYTYIRTATDGGTNFDDFANPLTSVPNPTTSTDFASATAHAMINITNTSTHKVRFGFASDQTGLRIDGSSSINTSFMTFIRLGDSQ